MTRWQTRRLYRQVCRSWDNGCEAGLGGYVALQHHVDRERPTVAQIAFEAGNRHARQVVEAAEGAAVTENRCYVTWTVPDTDTWALCLAEAMRP